jgi:AraC-like DNA-binding protein
VDYLELQPHPALAPYVKCYWILQRAPGSVPPRGGNADDPRAADDASSAARRAATPERVFPDGRNELIFHRGGRFELAGPDGTFRCQPRALLFGQIERHILLRPPTRIETIGVRFHPAGAAALTGIDAGELTGRAHDLGELLGRPAAELQEQVLEAADAPAALCQVDAFLTARLRAMRRRRPVRLGGAELQDAAVGAALAAIERSAGRLRVIELAREAGIGVRQLERRFRDRVGLSPKRLATIVRFQRAFGAIAAGSDATLTEIAHDSGYFDQSHFIRDFRRLAGCSPSRFFRDEGEMGRLFVLR